MDKQLFRRDSQMRTADTTNEAGGKAFTLDPKTALAQLAMTGAMGDTYYLRAELQLDQLLEAAAACDPEFVAQTAVYARCEGGIKDAPALLMAYLAAEPKADLWKRPTAELVLNNGRMVRNFVQAILSGKVLGRHGIGNWPKQWLRGWLNSIPAEVFVRNAIGQSPSMKDLIRLAHPKADTPERNHLFKWCMGLDHDPAMLPAGLATYHDWKKLSTGDRMKVAQETGLVPDVPIEMLTSSEISQPEWEAVVRLAVKRHQWHWLRMNVNTMLRHNVLHLVADEVAAELANPVTIRQQNILPFQIYAAARAIRQNLSQTLPQYESVEKILAALEKAAEISFQRLPKIEGKTFIFIDLSGSMSTPVTGGRTAASKVSARDAAAFFGAALAKSSDAVVWGFTTQVHPVQFRPQDSVLTIADAISHGPSGGTSVSAPLDLLLKRKFHADTVIYLSDDQSWADDACYLRGTRKSDVWREYKRRVNSKARQVAIDLQPYTTSQIKDQQDVLHLGGWSDRILDVVASWLAGTGGPGHWVREIEKIKLIDK